MVTKSKKDLIREAAEQDLLTFIKLVHPMRVIGGVHEELISWWTRQEAKSHQLVLLPRDHGKSAYVAYRAAWEITRNPAIRILYISSTANLATKQLKFIKDILTSDIYRRYWPNMVNPEEGKREKWTETEICVDHPLRKQEAIRDSTVFTGGLTTGITGLHCDIAILDDVVVRENAYTQEGRDKVQTQYSMLSSIEGTEAKEWVVGTRYDPNDLYKDLLEMRVQEFDENGHIIKDENLYEVFEKTVEDAGDGTGEYIWPRQQRYDGKWFGFNSEILAIKRAQYLDKMQFRAQYYNNPNDEENAPIKEFQYYEPKLIVRRNRDIFYGPNKLNVFAAVDFAFSLGKRRDYTSIVVVGVDIDNNYYVLDIKRFKTDLIRDYYTNILELHNKWYFKKIRAETVSAQKVIVKDLKENYFKPNGIMISIDEYSPSRHDGTKEERMLATLKPRYENKQIWHYKGGNCQILEEELSQLRPPHDDVKDTLTAVIDIAVAPTSNAFSRRGQGKDFRQRYSHPRFGGIG